jgi:salicylate hydroxylase
MLRQATWWVVDNIVFQVGAGLQITPNASRLLYEWGLQAGVERAAAEPTFLTVHRYSNGKVLAMEKDFNVKIRAKYGAPFLDLHRADLQKILYERATHLGVTVRLGARVVEIFPGTTEVITESGEKYAGDLIVGADGLWSRCRESSSGQKDNPLPTGDLAYRIVLTLDQITDPELREWVSTPSVHFWVGPGSHVVGYSLSAGTMYNLVLLCPDDLPKDVSRQAGSVGEMRKLFANWDPILTRFLDQVDTVDKWKLMYRSPLDSWTNEKGTFVLIGDSCHPMLPYLAQGANSSLEDGGVLGRLLERLESKEQLPQRIKLYERLRKTRSEAIVRETFHQRDAFHMPDGPEQEERDKIFASQLGKEITCKFPSRWTCAEVQPWLYGYDAHKEADSALASL